MKIGVFGTGMVGRTLSDKLGDIGHEVTIGTRNVDATLARTDGDLSFSEWIENHPGIRLGSFGETARHGKLLINATAGTASLEVLNSAGKDNLAGKILVDLSNPLDFTGGFPPKLTVCNTDSLGEQIQRAYPELKVVKTLNTVTCYLMVDPGLVPGDHTIFVSGNDGNDKAAVAGYLTEWFGWKKENIIDLGDITTARGTEMLLALWVRLYGKFQNPMFNFHVVQGEAPRA